MNAHVSSSDAWYPNVEKTSETDPLQAKAQHDGLPDLEREQAMEQWLRQVPDEPGELLRRKFLYEQRKRQEVNR